MGEAFITRRGGGIGASFAVIAVTYPSGSTCTCTNGTKTFRAKGDTGSFLFLIPEAGTWTVSCTDGTSTASQSVSITAQYQAETVTLSYEFIIFDYQTWSGSVGSLFSNEGDGAVSLNSDNTLYVNRDSDSGGSVITVSSYGLSGHQNLKITATNPNFTGKMSIVIDGAEAASQSIPVKSEYSTSILDISGTSGQARIRLSLYHSNVRRIWLE